MYCRGLCYFGNLVIKFHIKELAEKRGITTAYQLRLAMGVSPTLASRLWKEEFAKIGVGTLDRLCHALKCKPGRLITFEPNEN